MCAVVITCASFVVWFDLVWFGLGGFDSKQQMIDDKKFPKMHLDLQRLLQVKTSVFCIAMFE